MDWLLLQLGAARTSVSSFLLQLQLTLLASFSLCPIRAHFNFHRYEGGPGDGQWDGDNGDSGSGSGGIVYQQSRAALDQLSIAMVAGVCFLAIALFL